MVLVYPGALGLDESVADCSVRAFSAMLLSGVEPWDEGVFWLMVVVGLSCACATSVRTRRRHEQSTYDTRRWIFALRPASPTEHWARLSPRESKAERQAVPTRRSAKGSTAP